MIIHIPCGVNTLNLPPDLVDQVAAMQTLLLRKAVRLGDTKPASQKDVARHEAGHAVIAALLGVKLRCCWIKQEHGIWGGYTEPDEPANWFILLSDAKQRVYTPIGCLARAYFGLAGPLAERQQGGGAGPVNLAVDLPELVGVFEALRVAIVMAMFPDHQPTTDEEQGRQDHAPGHHARLPPTQGARASEGAVGGPGNAGGDGVDPCSSSSQPGPTSGRLPGEPGPPRELRQGGGGREGAP